MDVDAAAKALEDAGFAVVVHATEPAGSVGGVATTGRAALEATRGLQRVFVTVHRFADGRRAIEAGSGLGSETSGGRRYFAAGPILVVIEADDPDLAESVSALLTAR